MLSDKDIEIMSHVEPQQLAYSNKEVLDIAYENLEVNLGFIHKIPKENAEVLIDNMYKVYSTVIFLLTEEFNSQYGE